MRTLSKNAYKLKNAPLGREYVGGNSNATT
jgi:hypothetical protein